MPYVSVMNVERMLSEKYSLGSRLILGRDDGAVRLKRSSICSRMYGNHDESTSTSTSRRPGKRSNTPDSTNWVARTGASKKRSDPVFLMRLLSPGAVVAKPTWMARGAPAASAALHR